MLNRRQFLGYGLTFTVAATTPLSWAETDFERYMREQEAGVQQIKQEWEDYKENYLAAYNQYRNEISRVWSDVETSDQKTWVEYSDNYKVRRVVDFEKNEVRLSFTQEEAKKLNDQKLQQELQKAVSSTVEQAYKNDPTLTASLGQQVQNKKTVSGVSAGAAQAQLKQAQRKTQTTKKGEVVTVVVPLPAAAVPERAKSYLPLVQKQSQRWQLPASLVIAVMHTESAFNPMARSHIPAFGLMQIVPGSAGRDATKHAWGKERLLTGQDLYRPETNIELGCAYLNLLNTRYLAAVKDPKSRQYCIICAYNTGAGNVARAFSGTTSVAKAAPKINSMTPQQVYNHLHKNLPHQETRDYLQRVTTRMNNLQA